MSGFENFDSDDFPMSPSSLTSGQEFYDSYLRCEEIFNSIPKKERISEPSNIFSNLFVEVAAQMKHNALFRQRNDANADLSTLWLSKARSSANLLLRFNVIPSFSEFSEENMKVLVKNSANPEMIPAIAKYLWDFGIILVYEPAISSMKTDGAVFTVSSGNPVVAMSLRYSRIDSYWFTLMHELSHIVLHYSELEVPIIDSLEDADLASRDRKEIQADKLALNSTISRSDWRSLPVRYDIKNEVALHAFAERVGVHPAIVAGRLRKELNRYDIFSKVVNDVDVRKIIWK